MQFNFYSFSRSYAKLNLTLKIGDYDPVFCLHRIKSRMVLIDFFETLFFDIAYFPLHSAIFRFNIKPCEQLCPDIEKNLMLKAARLWCDVRDIGISVSVLHNDNVPTARGFGIASSNAVCMIKALEDGLNGFARKIGFKDDIGIKSDRIKAICKRLGSDVPFFASGISDAAVSGFGDIVEKTRSENDTPERFLIAIPPYSSKSKEAFSSLYENGIRKLCDFEHLDLNEKAKRELEMATGVKGWKTTGSGTAHFVKRPTPKTLRMVYRAKTERDGGFRFIEVARMRKALDGC